MKWQTNPNRWRNKFALFPRVVGKNGSELQYIWLEKFQWRYSERRAIGGIFFERRVDEKSDPVEVYSVFIIP